MSNLDSLNLFIKEKFQKKIELIESDEVLQVFTSTTSTEDVLKDALLYCEEATLETNQTVDREYRSYFGIVRNLDTFVYELHFPRAAKIVEKLDSGKVVYLWEIYQFVLNNFDLIKEYDVTYRLLISLREMQIHQG